MVSGFFLGGIADSIQNQQAIALKEKQLGIQQQYANQEQQRFQQAQFMKLRQSAVENLKATIEAEKESNPGASDLQIMNSGHVAAAMNMLSGYDQNLSKAGFPVSENDAKQMASTFIAGPSDIQREARLAGAKASATGELTEKKARAASYERGGLPSFADNPDVPGPGTGLGTGKPPSADLIPGKTAQASESDAPAVDPGKSVLTGLATRSGMLPESLDVAGRSLAAGNTSVLTNLGRGKQGGETIKAVRGWAAYTLMHEQNLTPQQAADQMNFNIQNYKGQTAAQTTIGKRAGSFALAENEFESIADLVTQASSNVPRGQYKTINDVTNAWREGTGDPNIVKFGVALNSAVNVYARAINPTGASTVSDKEHAREILQKGWSNGQIGAAIEQLKKEIAAAKKSIPAAQQSIRGKPEDPVGLFPGTQ